jgi:hypothetical protein
MRRAILDPVVLSDDERQQLERWPGRPENSQELAFRCRIVLSCADDGHNSEVGARLGVGRSVV